MRMIGSMLAISQRRADRCVHARAIRDASFQDDDSAETRRPCSVSLSITLSVDCRYSPDQQGDHPHGKHDPRRLGQHVPGRLALSPATSAKRQHQDQSRRIRGYRSIRIRHAVQARSPDVLECVRPDEDRAAGCAAGSV